MMWSFSSHQWMCVSDEDSIRKETGQKQMGYKQVLISARSSPIGNTRGPMADMPLSTAAEAPYLGCGLGMTRSVTSMPAANQSSPSAIDRTVESHQRT